MFQMTEKIHETLKDSHLNAFIIEGEHNSRVWTEFPIDNGPTCRIEFINDDDRNDTAVRVHSLLKVSEEKRENMYEVLNDLNSQFRVVKFVCDKHGFINAEYDFPMRDPDPTSAILETILRFKMIIDQAYPQLLKALWFD